MKRFLGIVFACIFTLILFVQVAKVRAQSTDKSIVAPITGPINYVAMGDSYSSGEGNPPWEPDKNSQICHRSFLAWPMHFYLHEIINKQTKFANIACSGAKASDALTQSYNNQKPQIAAMAAIKPNLVTITIGGNDIGLKSIIESCAASGLHLRFICTNKLKSEIALIEKFGKIIPNYFSQIKNKAPKNARIFVVAYPRLLPVRWQDVYLSSCHWLSDENRIRMNGIVAQLDDQLAKGATAAGIDYIPTTIDSLNGHELCTKSSWINPLFNSLSTSQVHPTIDGQNALGDAVANYFLSH